MLTREEMQNTVDEGKPRPTPHLDAETLADVYPVEELVGIGNLRLLAVKEWQDKVESGEGIETKSRFVSARLQRVVQIGDVKKSKTLRYLLLLLDWFRALKPGPKGVKKVPMRDELKIAVEGVGSELLDGVRKRFAEGSELNKWHVDNIITHICALALTIDNFTTDISHLCYDMRLEAKEYVLLFPTSTSSPSNSPAPSSPPFPKFASLLSNIKRNNEMLTIILISMSKYFHEIGCKVAPPTETERTKMKITKAEAAVHKIAKLKLPLEFPKNRNPVAKRKR